MSKPPTLFKPGSRSRMRKMERHRERPNYPALTGPGDTVLVERDECRLVTAAKDNPGKKQVLRAFVYTRLAHPPATSKYTPHAGKKQLAKGNK